MTKPSLSSYLREHLDSGQKKKEPGPFLTVSRQYGCDGFELGQVLVRKLNERDEQQRWCLYYKELLQQLAEDTGVAIEVLEKERISQPGMIKDFLRGLKRNVGPDRLEIQNNIKMMVRTLAIDGYCIIIGQGGAAATTDLGNGLSIRVEAPREWRIARICRQESLDQHAATAKVEQIDAERDFLRDFYTRQNRRIPAFNLLFDNSVFSVEQIAQLVMQAMEEKGIIEKPE